MLLVRGGRVPEAVVRGDVLRVSPGSQLKVDGPVLAGAVDVDGSLLIGESDAQLRTLGQGLLSGNHCVAGAGLPLARDVCPASFANPLTAEAGGFPSTPLRSSSASRSASAW